MAVELNYVLSLSTNETIAIQVDDAQNPTITHDQFVVRGTLDGTTSVPVADQFSGTLGPIGGGNGGTVDLDLDSYTGTGGGTKSADGQKVIGWQINNTSSLFSMSVEDHPSNPFYLLGASGNKLTIPAGGTTIMLVPTTAGLGTVVNLSSHTLRFSGQSGESFQLKLIFG